MGGGGASPRSTSTRSGEWPHTRQRKNAALMSGMREEVRMTMPRTDTSASMSGRGGMGGERVLWHCECQQVNSDEVGAAQEGYNRHHILPREVYCSEVVIQCTLHGMQQTDGQAHGLMDG